jgi:hypothetical protein
VACGSDSPPRGPERAAWRVYGSLVFLEMPGAFLLTLAFVLHARSAKRRDT